MYVERERKCLAIRTEAKAKGREGVGCLGFLSSRLLRQCLVRVLPWKISQGDCRLEPGS